MGKILLAIVLGFLLFAEVPGQIRSFLSPGVKLGYAFGKNGGFIWGVEISYVFQNNKKWIYGIVLSNDNINDANFFHLGFETGYNFAGIELGPIFLISNKEGFSFSKSKLGFSSLLYAGGFVIPYYRFTYIPDFYSIQEAGTFLKIHIQTTGSKYNLNLSGG